MNASGGYDYVLNLSALKHVRSEKDPFTLMRLVEVNVLNTIKTLAHGPRAGRTCKYFCVSTDKAANPVNMMGASKRIMEMFLMRESESLAAVDGTLCQRGVFRRFLAARFQPALCQATAHFGAQRCAPLFRDAAGVGRAVPDVLPCSARTATSSFQSSASSFT
jgi:hypothetical protein